MARRYPTKPRPAKPSSMSAQVEGSGTGLPPGGKPASADADMVRSPSLRLRVRAMALPHGDVCAGIERNAGLRENRAGEVGGSPQGSQSYRPARRPALPLGAVDKLDLGGAGRRQRAVNLKDEDSVRIALSVQRQCPCELRRRGEGVDARRQGKAAKILSQTSCPWTAARRAASYAISASAWAAVATG